MVASIKCSQLYDVLHNFLLMPFAVGSVEQHQMGSQSTLHVAVQRHFTPRQLLTPYPPSFMPQPSFPTASVMSALLPSDGRADKIATCAFGTSIRPL
jgi:hypothetical protein